MLKNIKNLNFKKKIKFIKGDIRKYSELNKELNSKLNAAHDYKNTLIDKLRKHNLAKLSMKKPGLVEKKINRGTKKLFESFEKLSGAKSPDSTAPVK